METMMPGCYNCAQPQLMDSTKQLDVQPKFKAHKKVWCKLEIFGFQPEDLKYTNEPARHEIQIILEDRASMHSRLSDL
jgi:hypothetical protein